MTLRRFAGLAGLALLAACSDTSGPNSGTSGSFSFTFGGAMVSGSYSASGALPETGAQASQPWAFGIRETAEGYVLVTASRPQANNRYDYANLFINRTTVGTATINTTTCQTSECPQFYVFFNTSDASTTVGEIYCQLDAGTVTITSISSTRAAGTFSGTGLCLNDGGTEGSFSVQNGSFDVALVSTAANLSMRLSMQSPG